MEQVNVYVRKEDMDENEYNDIWDDELLIKAYNKSVKGIKQKIAQRMGVLNGISEPVNNVENTKKSEMKKKKSHKKWNVGDFCRAIYSDDGLEYEAIILNFRSDGHCLVKYLGYENEEWVKIKNLKKSSGGDRKSMQNKQSAIHSPSEVKDTIENKAQSESHVSYPTLPGIPAIPPPPPLSLTSQFHQGSESDALSAMLMSWYMSGYHTGYYQGLMQAKKQSQKMTSSNENQT